MTMSLYPNVPAAFENDIEDDAITLTSEYSIAKATIAMNHLKRLEEEDDDTAVDDSESEEESLCPTSEEEDDDVAAAAAASDDDDGVEVVKDITIYTENELMLEGLKIIGYTERRILRAKYETNKDRFRSHFGSNMNVCICIWEDLQTATINEAWVPPTKRNIKHFLMTLHFLKRYPTEIEREAIFDISPQYGREWVWYYVEKIQALKAVKIKWPEDFEIQDDVWILTVDGTHCWIHEPKHPDWSQDSKYFSHKYGKAGINYELGILLTSSRLIWMNGPFKAGMSDKQIFKEKGLKEKLKSVGKKGIGDLGYTGHYNELSLQNPHDSKEVDRFKSRALKRHERFNGYTKAFDCLSGRFRHSVKRFANCFEAVCVICQYQIENGFDLYDILLEDMAYEI